MATKTRSLCLALEALLVAGFFVGILLPPVLHVTVGGDGEGARMEYRKPAQLPPFSFDTKYPRAFEKYFDDNFALRTALVRWHNRIKLFWLGASPSPSFVVGEDGWLYYTGERIIENHVGELRLTRQDLDQWQRVLEARRDWCAERGITYLFVVVPDKHCVYPEYLPAAYRNTDRRTTYEQFVEHFEEHSDLELLELRPLLRAARETEEHLLYYKLGTHWNDLGAWLGYEAIMERLASAFPRLAPLERPGFVIDPTAKDDNFGSRLLLHEEMPQDIVSRRPLGPAARLVAKKDPPVAVRVWESAARSRAPRAVMFHDSQGDWLQAYLADTFSRLTTVSKGAFDRELIEREGARVVIEEIGERRLWRVPRR